MRLAVASCLLLGALAALPLGAGQADATTPELRIVALSMDAPVAVEPVGTPARLEWTLRFPQPVTAEAAEAPKDAHVEFTLQCQKDVTMDAPVVAVELVPGKADYDVTTPVTLQASKSAPGVVPIDCSLGANFTADAGAQRARSPPKELTVTVGYIGSVMASVVDPDRTAGPQRQIPYQLALANLGNARTQVTFEVVDKPHGKWNSILPEVLLLDAPGTDPQRSTATTVFVAATPFHDGYVSSDGPYRIRLLPSSADDPSLKGEPVEVSLTAHARGWYVPGPPLVLVVATLGIAAALRRQRV